MASEGSGGSAPPERPSSEDQVVRSSRRPPPAPPPAPGVDGEGRLRPWLQIWWRRWGPTLRCALTAVAAWVITVAPVASARGAGILERLLAAGALVAGLTAAVLALEHHRLARHVGLTGFVGLSASAWLAATLQSGFPRIDLYRSLLGALAWGLFALSWSHPWSSPGADRVPGATRVTGRKLTPRRRPPRYALGVTLFGALASVACLVLAWRITPPSRAVLAQTVAVAASLALLGGATALAVAAGRPAARGRGIRWPRASRGSRRLLRSVLLLLALASAALALLLTRH